MSKQLIGRTINYPLCYKSFIKLIESNEKWSCIYNNFVFRPKTFDVTLRDGLQSLSKEEQEKILENNSKIKIFSEIVKTHNPSNIEIGSLCSEKVLPIFKDSIDLYKKTYSYHFIQSFLPYVYDKPWLLVANENHFKKIYENKIYSNLSFITSVSESFQQKNTRMTIKESIQGIANMLQRIDDFREIYCPSVKLYVSCINECPIEGKLTKQHVVNHLIPLFSIGVDKICLSDTCGTLDHIEFDEIIKELLVNNISLHKIGLHLHVKNEEIVEKIIHKALDYGIMDFDVSILKSGGCSVTMEQSKLAPNLSYELYYKSVINWFIKNY